MGREPETPTLVKIGVFAGLSYGIYRLLCWADGLGGEGQATTTGPAHARVPWSWPSRTTAPAPPVASAPPAPPATPAPAPRPRPPDPSPLEVLVRPSDADPRQTVIEAEGRALSVGDLIARIDAGGRRDVRVAVRGDTRQGGWVEIREALAFAGIQVLLRLP